MMMRSDDDDNDDNDDDDEQCCFFSNSMSEMDEMPQNALFRLNELINIGSIFHDIFSYVQLLIPTLSTSQRLQFVKEFADAVMRKGVKTDAEICESLLNKDKDDITGGRFLVHGMDWLIIGVLYVDME